MNQLANPRRPSHKDARCKKHPTHPPSPGVCSLCLNEKLAELTSASGSRTKLQADAAEGSSSGSSVSSYYSSSSASSRASPMRPYLFTKEETIGNSTRPVFLLNGKQVFTKSKSMVSAVPRTIIGAERVVEKRKKPGFWSKLLHPKSKRSMVVNTNHHQLFHSRTLAIR